MGRPAVSAYIGRSGALTLTGLPQDIKGQIQQATDIVRLIGEHIALRPRGKEFVGLCPFHDDRHPSLYVSPSKQIYKCFACGAGGDVFAFVMNYHRMSFPEALRYLADRAGIRLPAGTWKSADGNQSEDLRQRLLKANALAAAFFQGLLRHSEHGRVAREYLARRNISPQMIAAFGIGYAPDRWDGLALTAAEKGWSVTDLEAVGLLVRRDQVPGSASSGYYDRFRHRLMFPICDVLGRPIAFGGRKLREEDEPKYLNSPESPLFSKAGTLYGLHLARKAILESRTAVVVEGYTDVIACHQHGLQNVVATLGTALTAQHAAQLRRYCDRVILVYDADEAGVRAADRAVEVFLNEGLDVLIAILPGQQDPADLLGQPDGIELWHQALRQARDALDFLFQRMRSGLGQAETITARQRLAEDYLRRLAQLGLGQSLSLGGPTGATAVLRQAMIRQRLAELLKISEQELQQLIKKLQPARSSVGENAEKREFSDIQKAEKTLVFDQGAARLKALQQAERQVVACLVQHPELFHQTYIQGRLLDEALTPEDMVTPLGRSLYRRVYEHLVHGRSVSLTDLLAELAEEGETDLAAALTSAILELDQQAGQDRQRAETILRGAVGAVLAYRRQEAYHQSRQAVEEALQDRNGSQALSERLRQLTQNLAEVGWSIPPALRRKGP